MTAPYRRPRAIVVLRAMLLLGACLSGIRAAADPGADAAPVETLKSYLEAVYARDYSTAYRLISATDRKLETEQEYLRGNSAFAGGALELTSALAALIRFEDLDTEVAGNHATITFKAIIPDANAPAIRSLLLEFDPERLDGLSVAERKRRAGRLREMAATGQLPVVIGEHERWELTREAGVWRLFLNWAGAVEVHFEALTRADLPWEFAPLQPVVRAVPGETLRATYRVKNLADRETTGKARHILPPPADTYLDVVQCFCFLEQTLEAGEEALLPVVFRVKDDVPDEVKQMRMRYELYPADAFPSTAQNSSHHTGDHPHRQDLAGD